MHLVDLPHSDIGPRDALAVVLLHGFPLDHRMWRAQKDALQKAGHRVIVPDLRGFGKAPMPSGPTEMAHHAADVLRLADRAGVRRFALAGFSMGGYVALELCRQARERLAGLALVDTRAEPDSEEAKLGRSQTAEKVRQHGMQVLVEAMLPKMLTPAAPQALRDEVEDMMLSQRPEGMTAALHAMATRPDSRPTLASLRVPTLIVVGDQDPVTPPDAARAMADAVPDARLVVVQEAAHLAPMERADDVSEALVAWATALGGAERSH